MSSVKTADGSGHKVTTTAAGSAVTAGAPVEPGSSLAIDPMANIILLTDSYKVSHYKQYPPGCTKVYSYFESRGGVYSDVVFFGLQYFIKRYLCGVVVTQEKIEEAADLYKDHFGSPAGPDEKAFYREGWEYILNNCGGKLPIKIRAVPEGTVVPAKNVLFTLENTDPKCFWLTNYLETLLVQVWYPMTVATHSREQKKVIKHFLEQSADPEAIGGVVFKLHDFGFRGVSSVESAGTGGAGHLVNFMGTDTIEAIQCCRKYYGEKCAGFSIPASEHSTITSWGADHECDAMKNMLESYPTGLVACVSDSYDVFKACSDYWGTELIDLIKKRDGSGCLVIRPDSGEPVDTTLKIFAILDDKFGMTTNTKGFKVLPPYVRVIWGDGIDYESLVYICTELVKAGYSTDSIGFGSGGGLLQKLNRDTQKCAFKCSECVVDGKARFVFKDPITDKGKKSKKGQLKLVKDGDSFKTLTECTGDEAEEDVMVDVYCDGALLVDYSFADIRMRAEVADGLPLAPPKKE